MSIASSVKTDGDKLVIEDDDGSEWHYAKGKEAAGNATVHVDYSWARAGRLTMTAYDERSLTVLISARRSEEGSKPPGAEPAEGKAEEQFHDGTRNQTGQGATLVGERVHG
jgi:hypothetical protein